MCGNNSDKIGYEWSMAQQEECFTIIPKIKMSQRAQTGRRWLARRVASPPAGLRVLTVLAGANNSQLLTKFMPPHRCRLGSGSQEASTEV